MKRIIALVLALAMVAMIGLAFAENQNVYPNYTNPHTITISNTDQNVSHSYKAFQVFKGNLDAEQKVLSDIDWGSGIDGDALLEALQNKFDNFDNCVTAADVAKVLSNYTGTNGENEQAGALDRVAEVIAKHVKGDGVAFTEGTGDKAKTYSATVSGDGYYFIVDTTDVKDLKNDVAADTLSKYIITIVDDTTIQAKDTGIVTDKEIVSDVQANGDSHNYTSGKENNNVAIGDTITFKITLKPIPNTAKYDTFKLVMSDTLEKGLTFTGITSVAAYDGESKVTDFEFATDYKYSVNSTKYETAPNAFEAPTDPVDAGAPDANATKTDINVTFVNFKAKAENTAKNLIGKTLVITYTAVLNKYATYGVNSNDNTEKFIFSNDPNYDYEGDDFDDKDPRGETPNSDTHTFSTTLKINKKAETENGNALAGAVFQLVGENILNQTLKTGIDYKLASAVTNPEDLVDTDVYYKLLDGSYTTVKAGLQEDGKTVISDTQYVKPMDEYKKVKVKDVVTTKVADYTQTATSGNDGVIIFKGLRAGTYKIKEIHAPDGYNLDETEYTLVIDWSDPTAQNATDQLKNAGGFSLGGGSTPGKFSMDEDGAEFEVTLVNKSGVTLPSTGGIGTTIFYILGGLLVVGAAVILVARRKAQD